jgi:hypothetical protein
VLDVRSGDGRLAEGHSVLGLSLTRKLWRKSISIGEAFSISLNTM